MSRRIIDMWWDLTNKTLRDSAGNSIGPDLEPRIHYREKPLVRLRIQTQAAGVLSAYDGLLPGYIYSAAVTQDWDSATANLCKTENTGINVTGDWESGGTADAAAGELSIRLDADNGAYDTAVGILEEILNTGLEIQALDGGDLVFVIDMPFHCLNLRDDAGGVPPAVPGNYYTKSEILALLAVKLSCEYFTEDGQRKVRLLTDAATGAETYEILTLPE